MSKFSEKLQKTYKQATDSAKKALKDADNIRKGCNTGRSPDEREAALKRVKQFPDEEIEQ